MGERHHHDHRRVGEAHMSEFATGRHRRLVWDAFATTAICLRLPVSIDLETTGVAPGRLEFFWIGRSATRAEARFHSVAASCVLCLALLDESKIDVTDKYSEAADCCTNITQGGKDASKSHIDQHAR